MQSRWNGPYFPKLCTLKYAIEVFELADEAVVPARAPSPITCPPLLPRGGCSRAWGVPGDPLLGVSFGNERAINGLVHVFFPSNKACSAQSTFGGYLSNCLLKSSPGCTCRLGSGCRGAGFSPAPCDRASHCSPRPHLLPSWLSCPVAR